MKKIIPFAAAFMMLAGATSLFASGLKRAGTVIPDPLVTGGLQASDENVGLVLSASCGTAALTMDDDGQLLSGDRPIVLKANYGQVISLSAEGDAYLTIDNNQILMSDITIGASGTDIVQIRHLATGSTDLGGAITANCTAETNFAMTGVAVGDSCTVDTPAALATTDWVVCRTLADNVALKYCSQGAAVDPAAMVFHITTVEY